MAFMADKPDNFYDLAIVDPPYGIGADSQKESFSQSKKGEGQRHRKQWIKKGWDDNIPNAKYFNELFRVSKNQVIWGGNYFIKYLDNTRCFLSWDKVQDFNGSDFELAWTSFDKPSKVFRMSRIEAYSNNNTLNKDFFIKIHPTQKPVKLYEWLLMNYAKEGDKILDTHGGSGSICIACHNLKFDLDWCELDKEYFDAASKRFDWYKKRTPCMFEPSEIVPGLKKQKPLF
jgi:site-specific DNA-methyltransferase (adenine-specific)